MAAWLGLFQCTIVPLLERIAFQTYRGPVDITEYLETIVYKVAKDPENE